jgi:hypothetical protein
MFRSLADEPAGDGLDTAALGDVEGAIGRLDGTVSQMAAELANLITYLEQERRG